jgi:CubicO group peptidase (beta-lactamase class C family)
MDSQCKPPPTRDFPIQKQGPTLQPITPSGLTTDQLLDKIKPIVQKRAVPAIAVAIVSPSGYDTIVKGTRKEGNPTLATTEDTFMTGPVSSTLVPIVIARLVERGLFAWTSTLEDLLRDLRNEIHPAHHSTTLEMLSCHLSGITTKFPDLDNGQLSSSLIVENINGYEGRRRTLGCLRGPPERVPGPGSSYRNAVNLMILAFVVEVVTNESWETILKREVFEPLRMENTGIGQPDGLVNGESQLPAQPWPHEVSQDGSVPHPLSSSGRSPWLTCSATFPALGVHSTLTDLVIYLQFCLRGKIAPPEPVPPILSFAGRSKLYTPVAGGDFTPGGFDVVQTNESAEVVLRCKGHVSGFSTGIWIAPDTGYAAIIIVNIDGPVGAGIRDEVYDLIA